MADRSRQSGTEVVSAVLLSLIVGLLVWYGLGALGVGRGWHIAWPDVWAPDWLLGVARHFPGWWPGAEGHAVKRGTMEVVRLTLACAAALVLVRWLIRRWLWSRRPVPPVPQARLRPISREEAERLRRPTSYRSGAKVRGRR